MNTLITIRRVIIHLFIVFACCYGVQASHNVFPQFQSLAALQVNQVHRTAFHFQSPRNWMNDPNGPMYYGGLYHLFYQYNPKGAVWGNIVWAHSVSKDLINWEGLEPALYPSKPFDINGCWSGSATVLPGNKPVILYTGVDTQNRQVQNYAIPENASDPYLRKWIKPDNNPLMVPDVGMNVTKFRDPTTAWWVDGHWKILIGGRRKRRGMAYLYRSKDFSYWVKAKHPIHSAQGTGMWECPDFYPVSVKGKVGMDTSNFVGEDVKHVLKVSLDETRYDYYTIGKYIRQIDRYIPDADVVDINSWSCLRYDYGNFYASKTFFDPAKKRRILWGWANESDTPKDDVAKGWAGIQTIPRAVWLNLDGKGLSQWPVEELETLRGNKVELSNHKLQLGETFEVKGITAAQADIEVTFSFQNLENAELFDPSWGTDAQALCGKKRSKVHGGVGPFGLLTLASKNLEEFTPVFFRIFKTEGNKHKVLLCSDASSSSLKEEGLYKPSFGGFVNVDLSDNRLALRSLIDHSVVESFGAGGTTCMTSRVYPTLAVNDDAHLYVFNNGAEAITVETLRAWSMNASNRMNN